MNNLDRINYLIEIMNYNSNIYYNNLPEQNVTDQVWDEWFDELKDLEKLTGIIMSNSPTQNAGYEVIKGLPKIKHSTPLLSLDKTKEVDNLLEFLGDREGVLMLKLDGGTEVVDYQHGEFNYLATRGSSSTNEGQDISHNARGIIGVPSRLGGDHHIQVVGEGIMYKSKLEEINKVLKSLGEKEYSNVRNLANASASMSDSQKVAEREVRFITFSTLEDNCFNGFKTKIDELEFLEDQGFETVYHVLVTKDNLKDEIEKMTLMRERLDYDIDGLVLAHNDMDYGRSLGQTGHHFKNAKAFKWEDDRVETTVTKIIEDVGKSAQISFKAEFDTVAVEGSDISYATLHNPSIINGLGIGVGARVTVYKANMVIPAIDEVIIPPKEVYQFSGKCPVCGSEAVHRKNADGSDTVDVYCSLGDSCPRVSLRKIVHWCSTEAMNIEGVSEETLKTISSIKNQYTFEGGTFTDSILKDVTDLYNLYNYREEMLNLPKFAKTKVDKILNSIEDSKNMPLNRALYGLSMDGIGRTASKKVAKAYRTITSLIDDSSYSGLRSLLGDSVGDKLFNQISDRHMIHVIETLKKSGVKFEQPEEKADTNSSIVGLKFCITGSLEKFENRKELEAKIESLGGVKQSGVSGSTNYLINNDIQSKSGKNDKANKLNIPIITEDQFISMIGETNE